MHLIGKKPLSTSGLIDYFQRERLHKAFHKDYPLIRKEGSSPGDENAGMIAYLRERFVDIEDGEENKKGSDHGSLAEHEGAHNDEPKARPESSHLPSYHMSAVP
jgi:hypothetical protein